MTFDFFNLLTSLKNLSVFSLSFREKVGVQSEGHS